MSITNSFIDALDSASNQADRPRLDITGHGNIAAFYKKFDFSLTPTGDLYISTERLEEGSWKHGRIIDAHKHYASIKTPADMVKFLRTITPQEELPLILSDKEANFIMIAMKRLSVGSAIPKPTI